MNIIRRFFYLIYYVRTSDFKQLKEFVRYSSELTGKSRLKIIADSFLSVFRYNISIKDYFCFRFFEISDYERTEWAGTGFLYEYQLIMNPKGPRDILEDKIRFLHYFKPFVARAFFTLQELAGDQGLAEKLIGNPSGRIVLKGSRGQVGAEVEVIMCSQHDPSSIVKYMVERKYDLAEEYVVQHPDLMKLSPSGLNTVRIITQLNDGVVDILGARLRISVDSPVDNMAAGNLATWIDVKTGIVMGPGVFSDITKRDVSIHPVTGQQIAGFVVPEWIKVVALATQAAKNIQGNRSVGWDIAITKDGPELIEGNHNWCKLLWQLPVKQGLKKELVKYL
jgi:hypothetical protein